MTTVQSNDRFSYGHNPDVLTAVIETYRRGTDHLIRARLVLLAGATVMDSIFGSGG